jgi:hypothetical protein
VNCTKSWQLPPREEPVTDEYLSSATIGERKALNDMIRLCRAIPGGHLCSP